MSSLGDIKLTSIAAMLPELYLAISALFLLVYGVYRVKNAGGYFCALGFVVFLVTLILECFIHGLPMVAMNGMFVSDAFTAFAKCLVLSAGALTLLLSSGWLAEQGGRPFEYVILTLLSTLGALFMISANNLLTLYLGLEMSSLALYVLASFERDHAKSAEAGLKYFVLGALASGMLLFGISLIYGFAGSTGFDTLAGIFAAGTASKGLIVGMVLVIAALCFKISAVPFHMWTPDVYEGSPTPVVAFFATAPKVAALALFTRVLLVLFGPLFSQWQQVVIFVSVASMLVGGLGAIRQTNIKRLLAYSSIGHVGFMLIGLAAGNAAGVQAVLIYSALYIFMSAGAFGCVLLMKRHGHAVEDIAELRGLSQTSPLLALVFSAFMFSLAGIPPLSGFFGKMYAVIAAVQAGLTWLAAVGVIISVISCYYYIKVVKVMYFDEPAEPFDKTSPLSLRIGLAVAAAITFLFIVAPTPLVSGAAAAAGALLK